MTSHPGGNLILRDDFTFGIRDSRANERDKQRGGKATRGRRWSERERASSRAVERKQGATVGARAEWPPAVENASLQLDRGEFHPILLFCVFCTNHCDLRPVICNADA
jgi:hypothetical protein